MKDLITLTKKYNKLERLKRNLTKAITSEEPQKIEDAVNAANVVLGKIRKNGKHGN